MVGWLKENQMLAALVVICVTLLIALAMYFRLDLSWIPGILSRLIG